MKIKKMTVSELQNKLIDLDEEGGRDGKYYRAIVAELQKRGEGSFFASYCGDRYVSDLQVP